MADHGNYKKRTFKEEVAAKARADAKTKAKRAGKSQLPSGRSGSKDAEEAAWAKAGRKPPLSKSKPKPKPANPSLNPFRRLAEVMNPKPKKKNK